MFLALIVCPKITRFPETPGKVPPHALEKHVINLHHLKGPFVTMVAHDHQLQQVEIT